MSSIIAGNNKLCAKIAKALGIKHCKSLDLRMRLNEIVSIKAEFYPEIDGIKQLESVFKEYELIEKSKQEESEK